MTDTLGDMLEAVVHGAGIQDRDGAPGLTERACETYLTFVKLLADGGYPGKKLDAAIARIGRLSTDIIGRCDTYE